MHSAHVFFACFTYRYALWFSLFMRFRYINEGFRYLPKGLSLWLNVIACIGQTVPITAGLANRERTLIRRP